MISTNQATEKVIERAAIENVQQQAAWQSRHRVRRFGGC